MARARDAQGKFMSGGPMGAGGSEDFVPELGMERYLNRIDVPVSFAAAATTEVFDTVETGLQVELLGDTQQFGGLKWVLFGATLMPTNKTAMAGVVTGSVQQGITAQILEGTHTALVNRNHEDCRAQCNHWFGLLTSGSSFGTYPVPFDIVSPIPILSKRLTVGLVGHVDNANLNSLSWTVSLHWGVAPLHAGDTNALLQTRLLAE